MSDEKSDQAARERALRDMISQVEDEANGRKRPEKESPNDFVERRMREKRDGGS